MSIQEDSAEPQPMTVRERMLQLQNDGLIQPLAQPLSEDQSVDQPDPAPFGHLTVRVPRFRVFYDAPPSNATRCMFTEAVGFASEPRPRTQEEAANGITEVLDDSRAVYVDEHGDPCPAPIQDEPGTYEGDGWRKDGSSSLSPRRSFRMEDLKVIESKGSYVSLTKSGGVNGRPWNAGVIRWNGEREGE